jgi:hypothetical protein
MQATLITGARSQIEVEFGFVTNRRKNKESS